MNDDWRLRIDLHEPGPAHQLSELLGTPELEHDLERSFHDRVVVSVDGSEVFCYAGTAAQAERAEELIRRLAEQHGWNVEIELAHWHPTAELWEPAEVRDPETADDRESEREGRIARERRESAERGYPEFEVRVQCASRAQAGELSARLDSEDIPNLHRWSYLLIGATDEDSAQALAERVRAEAPAGTAVTIERNQRAIYDELPRSAFTVLGGLGA
jgi:hypothetical protein